MCRDLCAMCAEPVLNDALASLIPGVQSAGCREAAATLEDAQRQSLSASSASHERRRLSCGGWLLDLTYGASQRRI